VERLEDCRGNGELRTLAELMRAVHNGGSARPLSPELRRLVELVTRSESNFRTRPGTKPADTVDRTWP
jgi:hypothetical protein